MELPELQQGLQDIQQAQMPPEASIPPAEAPWLNMDNLMQGYGGWFGNDQGLGEMLLGQLRAHGVDTQAATEAMLRELLQGLVEDLNMLQQKLSGFTSAIAQQMQQTQAVADSVQAALDSQGANPMAQQMLPPEGAAMPQMNDVPADMGFNMGEPPTDVPPEGGTAPTDMPQPSAEDGAPEQPPVEQPPVEQPPVEGTPSDRRIKYVLSDAGLKHIRAKAASKNALGINSNILAACQGGF